MYDEINDLVEVNLNKLAESHNQSLFTSQFSRTNNKSLFSDKSKRLASYMESKGLIDVEPTKRQRCDLTEFGYHIYLNGGWINYLNSLEQEQLKTLKESENRKRKEEQKLELDIELQEKVLKDYNKTKKTARYGIIIAVLTLLYTIIKDLLF